MSVSCLGAELEMPEAVMMTTKEINRGGGHGLRTHAGGPLAPPVPRHWGDAVPWKLIPPFLFAAWKGWVG